MLRLTEKIYLINNFTGKKFKIKFLINQLKIASRDFKGKLNKKKSLIKVDWKI